MLYKPSPFPYVLTGRFWDPQNSKSLSLGSPGSPITKMVAVAGKLWCGCQNRVIVLNTATLVQEVGQAPHPEPGGAGDGPQRLRVASVWLCPPQHTLHVGQDSGRSVTCMVSAGPGVWVALQGSAQVRLYHATSYEQLAEADVTPPVHKMLAGKTPKFPFPGVFPFSVPCASPLLKTRSSPGHPLLQNASISSASFKDRTQ